jgi:RNA polymerase sigma-70 factor (ECF subfamily)
MKRLQVPDEDIIKQVILGDTASFKVIIDRYQKQIYGIGMRFFRNEDDSLDFVQEVFISAYKSIKEFRGRSPFRFWLVRIAYNHGINQVQSRKMESDISDLAIPARGSTPEDAHFAGEVKALLLGAVENLPERYKISLDLYFFLGLSYRQIHDITGVPVNTIKSDVLRAKQILRDTLKGTIAEDYHDV